MKRRLLIVLFSVAGLSLGPTSPASATSLPPRCERPALTIVAPSTVALGARTAVLVRRDTAATTPTADPYTLVVYGFGDGGLTASRPVPTDPGGDRHEVSLGIGPLRAMVQLSWLQDPQPWDPDRSAARCDAYAFISSNPGAAPVLRMDNTPALAGGASADGAVLIGGRPCDQMRSLLVRMTISTKGTVRPLTMPTPCGPWASSPTALPGLRVRPFSAVFGPLSTPAPAGLAFTATSRGLARLTVTYAGRPVLRRWILSVVRDGQHDVRFSVKRPGPAAKRS